MEFDFFGHGKSWKVMEFELPKSVWTLYNYAFMQILLSEIQQNIERNCRIHIASK